ncbi:MAG: M24 family metallopeptidase [Chloroflexi bacterium]|nr:M24 family metallopeptidase [Chloroflexota bacterium]
MQPKSSRLIETTWPDIRPLPEPPAPLDTATYTARLDQLRAMMAPTGYTHLVIYGDREHFANLTYLTGFDPRFEEALLVLSGNDKPLIIAGNESLGYLPISPLYREGLLRSERYATFSLLDQPRLGCRQLAEILADERIGATSQVGCVGWKYLTSREHPNARHALELPSYIVDILRSLCPTEQVFNANDLLMHPAYGMRATVSSDEAAYFEYTNVLASEGMRRMLLGLEPDMPDYAVAELARLNGMPLGCHMTVVTGDTRDCGMNSPLGAPVRLGEPFAANVSYWGSNCCRAGWVAESSSDLPLGCEDYVSTFAGPYMAAMGEWFRALKIGATGGAVQQVIDALLPDDIFHIELNAGHLIHYDEWLSSPIKPGSEIPLRSGMVIQSDVIPSSSDYFSTRMEDGYLLADNALQSELSSRYPECYARCLERRSFMRNVLGLPVGDDLLPLSNLAGIVPPYLLDPTTLLALEA